MKNGDVAEALLSINLPFSDYDKQLFEAMARRTLDFRAVQIMRRTWRESSSSSSSNPVALKHKPLQDFRVFYSSVPENEDCVAVVADVKIKKVVGGGKKSIAEKILAVVDKIHERRLPPELRRGTKNCGTVDPARTEASILNVAEQRIVRSMLNGDLENLPGKGKPLRNERNPHADPAEDMAYRILASNGFAPEWVELNKEIRVKIHRWRASLAAANQRWLQATDTGVDSETVTLVWKDLLKTFEVELADINRKVLKYNLLVPFGRQVMSYKLEKELAKLQEPEKSQRTLRGF